MDIVELLLKESEITPAQYWEAQASMWHENYKEAADEIERLREQVEFERASLQAAFGELTKLDKDIKELKKTIETLEEEVYLRTSEIIHANAYIDHKE
jgi:peptidoglycan hydrolase CwlO-like protein